VNMMLACVGVTWCIFRTDAARGRVHQSGGTPELRQASRGRRSFVFRDRKSVV
jgi:hypothetical protein